MQGVGVRVAQSMATSSCIRSRSCTPAQAAGPGATAPWSEERSSAARPHTETDSPRKAVRTTHRSWRPARKASGRRRSLSRAHALRTGLTRRKQQPRVLRKALFDRGCKIDDFGFDSGAGPGHRTISALDAPRLVRQRTPSRCTHPGHFDAVGHGAKPGAPTPRSKLARMIACFAVAALARI